MKTITEILDEIAERNGFENWATAFQRSDKYDISDYHREAAEIYANQSRWVDINQALPEDGQFVLTLRENGYIVYGDFVDPKIPLSETGWHNVTHWQPLPEKP